MQFRDFLINGYSGNLGGNLGRKGRSSRRIRTFWFSHQLFGFLGSFHPSVGREKSQLQYQGINEMLKMTFVTVKSNGTFLIFLFLWQFENSIISLNLNRFLKTRSQMIDNTILLYIMKKEFGFFFIKFQKFCVQRSFRSRILEKKKHQSEANKFWQAATQGSHFLIIFKF